MSRKVFDLQRKLAFKLHKKLPHREKKNLNHFKSNYLEKLSCFKKPNIKLRKDANKIKELPLWNSTDKQVEESFEERKTTFLI